MKASKECRLFSEYRLLYTSTEEIPNTLKFMIQLKDKINLSSLSFALNQVKLRFPYFCVELKKDQKGYYFIKNDRDIKLENNNIKIGLNTLSSNLHFISFQYSDDNYIIINLAHCLTDGKGAYELIKTLLYYYITNAYKVELSKENIRLIDDEIKEEEINDPLLNIKNIIKPERIETPVCLNVIKENLLENQNKVLYHLSIDEKELMDYVKTIKATPNTLMALLLAKAIKKENVNSDKIIRMNICFDLRKLLNTPLAHQCLVGAILFDYDEKLINLSFEEQIKVVREKVKESLEEPQSLNSISSAYNLLLMLSNLKDEDKIKQISDMINNKTKETVSASISYVGKANFGDIEQYITDFKTITISHTPIMIEISAVNGRFYLDFIQNFEDERYIKAFKEELESLKIKYEVKDVCKIELPGFNRHSLDE